MLFGQRLDAGNRLVGRPSNASLARCHLANGGLTARNFGRDLRLRQADLFEAREDKGNVHATNYRRSDITCQSEFRC